MSTDASAEPIEFNSGYKSADVYDDMLPPHYYLGREDIDVVADLLTSLYGPAPDQPRLRMLDIGAGPGRVTHILAPYAADLHGTDKSVGMVERFREVFPGSRATAADTEQLLADLHAGGEAGTYDLIGTFWSMSYPLLECFEETGEDGVVTVGDLEEGKARAAAIVERLVGLLAPGGNLVGLFFDADSAEQRLVTEIWERIAPFPGTGRGFTWELLRDGLLAAERAGHGRLTLHRLPGVALCDDVETAVRWYNIGHLNSYAELLADDEVQRRIRSFAEQHVCPDGRVHLPSGVHLIHFAAGQDPMDMLPPELR